MQLLAHESALNITFFFCPRRLDYLDSTLIRVHVNGLIWIAIWLPHDVGWTQIAIWLCNSPHDVGWTQIAESIWICKLAVSWQDSLFSVSHSSLFPCSPSFMRPPVRGSWDSSKILCTFSINIHTTYFAYMNTQHLYWVCLPSTICQHYIQCY